MSGLEVILPLAMTAASVGSSVIGMGAAAQEQQAAEAAKKQQLAEAKAARQRERATMSQRGDLASREAEAKVKSAQMEFGEALTPAIKGVLREALGAEQRDIVGAYGQSKLDEKYEQKTGKKAISQARGSFRTGQIGRLIGGIADAGKVSRDVGLWKPYS